ncbi:hypothetical protein HYU15_03975 [Candidatus Woesearchaeota archaeon]|nr:hypothetical protein [Candidatus Woesearchaeota archaeon]
MRAKVLLLLFIFSSLIIKAAPVFAQGIAVSPDRLDFFVTNEHDVKQLIIYNSNNDVLRFRVSSDSGWFAFDKQDYEKVRVTATPGAAADNGKYNYYLTVSASSEATGNVALQLGASIRTAVTIARQNKASMVVGMIISITIVAAGLLAYWLLGLRHKQKNIYRSYI